MLSNLVAFLVSTSMVNSLTVPQNPNTKRGAASDPPFQKIPAGAVPAIKFDSTAKTLKGLPPYVHTNPPAEYQARSIDIPFGRLFHGKMKFFSAGQFNLPGSATSVWGKGKRDNTNQSACGIPDDAFFQSKVAIHPYFLKYAGLERYCMQDVCISFWNEDPRKGHQSDMMLKVTDICTTDPKDPTHCATPQDIKIDRVKAQIMEHMTGPLWSTIPQLSGNEFKGNGTWWFFTKCFADGLVQPPYRQNWFAQPSLPNNVEWSQNTQAQQRRNNQLTYPAKKWQLYPNGAYTMTRNPTTSPPLDWHPGDPVPAWCPIAGGKGWGIPTGKNCQKKKARAIKFRSEVGPQTEPRHGKIRARSEGKADDYKTRRTGTGEGGLRSPTPTAAYTTTDGGFGKGPSLSWSGDGDAGAGASDNDNEDDIYSVNEL
ncbi:MAG: hypothetical protein Q9214_005840 [Letrouitia sp. 1 TL-2023]